MSYIFLDCLTGRYNDSVIDNSLGAFVIGATDRFTTFLIVSTFSIIRTASIVSKAAIETEAKDIAETSIWAFTFYKIYPTV